MSVDALENVLSSISVVRRSSDVSRDRSYLFSSSSLVVTSLSPKSSVSAEAATKIVQLQVKRNATSNNLFNSAFLLTPLYAVTVAGNNRSTFANHSFTRSLRVYRCTFTRFLRLNHWDGCTCVPARWHGCTCVPPAGSSTTTSWNARGGSGSS